MGKTPPYREDSAGEPSARTVAGGASSSLLQWQHHGYKSPFSLVKAREAAWLGAPASPLGARRAPSRLTGLLKLQANHWLH